MTTPEPKDSSDTNMDHATDKPATSRWYRCLSCGAPSPQFYFRYGEETSKNNIQLTECSACHALVDPYMEREWLLVVMDLILLRQEAFRHVYWNRLDTEYFHIRKLTTEPASSTILPLLIFAPWLTLLKSIQDNFSMISIAFQRVYYSSRAIVSVPSSHDPPEKHDLLILGEIILIVGMYCWTWIRRPRNCLPGFRYWHMAHCAISIPLVWSSLVGWLVSRVWNHGDSQDYMESSSWEVAHQLYYLGLRAWVLLWQLSGIQVVTTALPTSMGRESQ